MRRTIEAVMVLVVWAGAVVLGAWIGNVNDTRAAATSAELAHNGDPDLVRTEMRTDPSNGRVGTVTASAKGGLQYSCTGFLVGVDLVLTARHCVEDWDQQGLVVDLGTHRDEHGNVQTKESCTAHSVHATSGELRTTNDYAVVTLAQCGDDDGDAGVRAGWYALHDGGLTSETSVSSLGYPGNTPPGSLWSATGEITSRCWNRCAGAVVEAELRTARGNSGGPLLLGDQSSDVVVGIVVAVGSDGTVIRRIDSDVRDLVEVAGRQTP